MKINNLGTTGIKVSHIGLGGAAFSNIYEWIYIKRAHNAYTHERDKDIDFELDEERRQQLAQREITYDETRSLDLIKESLKRGINYIETGPWYGQGSSERTIGKALKGVPRDSYTIASKVGRYEKETEKMFDFSAEKTEVGVESTLERLQLEYVDLIQVHDPTFAADPSVILKETLPVLERAVRDGKARYIGIADYDLDLMVDIVEESEVKISTILSYAKSTLCDNRLQKYTNYFKSKGIGIVNAAATGMGLLSNRGPQPWHPASDDIKAICKRASEYCTSQNVELARIATWFTLNQPDIDTNICGFTNVEQLVDTLQIQETGLTDHEKTVLADVQARFFGKEPGALHWDDVELPIYKAKLNKIQTKN